MQLLQRAVGSLDLLEAGITSLPASLGRIRPVIDGVRNQSS